MNVTPSQLNAVLRTLREVGYTGLDEAEAQIVQAFNDGDLEVSEQVKRWPTTAELNAEAAALEGAR